MKPEEIKAIEECERYGEHDEDCLYHMCATCLKAYDQFSNRVLTKNKEQIAHIREQEAEIMKLAGLSCTEYNDLLHKNEQLKNVIKGCAAVLKESGMDWLHLERFLK